VTMMSSPHSAAYITAFPTLGGLHCQTSDNNLCVRVLFLRVFIFNTRNVSTTNFGVCKRGTGFDRVPFVLCVYFVFPVGSERKVYRRYIVSVSELQVDTPYPIVYAQSVGTKYVPTVILTL
jgi:hypothetical protein